MQLTIILDATLLSNFAHIQRPDLLRFGLDEGVATVPTVIAELQVGESRSLVPRGDWTWLSVVQLTAEEQRLAGEIAQELDPGESECLAVAQIRHCKFFSDDMAARRMAYQRGITFSGTLGVLLLLIEQEQITLEDADNFLTIMISHGYRSPVRSLRNLSSSDTA